MDQSIAETRSAIGATIGANIFAPADIAVYIARIGIVALKEKREATTQKAVTALTEFEKRYIGKMLEARENFPDRIFEGLGEIKRRLRRNAMIFDPEDTYFYRQIDADDVDKFGLLLNKRDIGSSDF